MLTVTMVMAAVIFWTFEHFSEGRKQNVDRMNINRLELVWGETTDVNVTNTNSIQRYLHAI